MVIRRVLLLATAALLFASVVAIPPVAAQPAMTPTATLQWEQCEQPGLTRFECASLDVPRDWSDPSVGVFTLAVIRQRATGPANQRIGSLFFNPGGPGGSGLEVMNQLVALASDSVKRRFDIVTWDPRGIGFTTPTVDCEPPSWDFPPATGEVDWVAFAANVRQSVRDANTECLARFPDVAPYVGTNNVVRDLDALRAAVGDERLNYWGASYGTRIGYVYAMNYPDRFRAILLDGPVSPRSSIEDFSYNYSTAADPALGMLFERYPQSKTHYTRVMAALEEAPLRISPTRTITRWDVGYGLEGNARSQTAIPLLATWLGQLDRALFGTDFQKRHAKRYLRSLDVPTPGAMAGLPAFVNCLDYSDRLTVAQQDAMGERIRDNAPITGWYRALQIPSACEGLDSLEPDPVPLMRGSDWASRILILGATRDSQTPYKWTTAMANAFKSSVVVSYVGNQHVTYGATPSTCVNTAANRYLLRLTLPPVDIACDNVVLE